MPPEGVYPSREALHSAINAWAAPRGYAFTVGKSTKKSSGRCITTFSCDRAGVYRDLTTQRMRSGTTRRTGCLFSLLAKESLDKTSWSITHRNRSQFGIHNHEPSLDKVAHPVHRKLSSEVQATVSKLANAGAQPREIRSYLRDNTTAVTTRQDISNCIAQAKRDLTKGQSNIHALANELDAEGFWNRMQLDDDNRVTAVLFAHPESLAYLKLYPEVLILDCTHKTNKYKMPLLDIVGVDACQRSFCIAFAFLSGEDESDFRWALDRLRSMYLLCNAALPSVILTDRDLASMNAVSHCFPEAAALLCLWHVNKAVLRNCLPHFTSDRDDHKGRAQWDLFYSSWHNLVASSSETTFDERLQQLKERYVPTHAEAVRYLLHTWLDLYKERVVKAWVDQHTHFENATTSRGEGIHHLLKMYMDSSQLDLFQSWRSIKRALLNQLEELRANQARQ